METLKRKSKKDRPKADAAPKGQAQMKDDLAAKAAKSEQEMSAALKAKVDEVKNLLASSRPDETMTRYQIGCAVVEMDTNKKRYGSRAVKLLAQAVGLDEDSLYRYAKVARAWPDERVFSGLAETKGRQGMPLAFSHFVVLADPKLTSGAREKMIETALAEKLSVRELEKRLPEPKANSNDSGGADAKTTSTNSATTSIKPRLSRIEQTLMASLKRFEDEVECADSSSQLEDAVVGEIEQAENLIGSLTEHAAQLKRRLARLRRDLEQAPKTSPAAPVSASGASDGPMSDGPAGGDLAMAQRVLSSANSNVLSF